MTEILFSQGVNLTVPDAASANLALINVGPIRVEQSVLLIAYVTVANPNADVTAQQVSFVRNGATPIGPIADLVLNQVPIFIDPAGQGEYRDYEVAIVLAGATGPSTGVSAVFAAIYN